MNPTEREALGCSLYNRPHLTHHIFPPPPSPWRWPCVAPLSGPSVGVVDRKKGENIGSVVGFLVVHQSGKAKRKGNQPATRPRPT